MTTALILAVLAQTASPTLAALRADPQEDQSVRAYRIPLELVGGLASGVVVGFLGTAALCGVTTRCGGDENLEPAVYFLLTAPLGVSAGITGIGALLDGDGSYWASSAAVLGASLLDFILIEGSRHDLGAGTDLVMLALPIIGGVVGYEASSHAHRSQHRSLSLAPTLTAGGHPSHGLALFGHF